VFEEDRFEAEEEVKKFKVNTYSRITLLGIGDIIFENGLETGQYF
jgi:hypothetical protein